MEGKTVEQLAEERKQPKVAKDLEPLLVPIGELTPHPRNYRRGDPDKIAESLERFGQLRPVVVRLGDPEYPNGVIVAGNHVHEAAGDRLGWSHLAAVREEMSDEDADAYLVADNHLAEVATNDGDALAALLTQLGPDGVGGTGYPETEDGLAGVIARLAPEGGSEFEQVSEDDATYRCPSCEYEWDGDPRPPLSGDG